MKKQVIAVLTVAAMLCFTACGESEKANTQKEQEPKVTTVEETTKESNKEVIETENEEEIETDVSEDITAETVIEAASPANLSDTYADLGNRSFIYDGNLYTLGKSTLQDFLDNGAEFAETENYDKTWDHKFRGQVDYGTIECKSANQLAMFSFANLNDDPVTMKECTLVGITYLNKFEYERKGTDSKLEFAFPNTLTLDELTANSGEPTAKRSNKEVSYTVVSGVYPKYDSGYTFFFDNDGLINGIIMEWIP